MVSFLGECVKCDMSEGGLEKFGGNVYLVQAEVMFSL